MGQNITENAQSLRRSFQLYKLSKLQLAFQSILPFLNSSLSDQDTNSIKSFIGNLLRNNSSLFQAYMIWLFKQVENKKQNFQNISIILVIAEQICLNYLLPLTKWVGQAKRQALYQHHFNKGMKYYQNSEYQNAMNQFDKLTVLFPKEPQLYFNKGVIFLRLNKIKESQNAFLKAIQLKKDYQSAFFNLLTVYQILKEHEKLQKCFDSLFKISPDNYSYEKRYLKYLHQSNKWDKAIPLYKKQIKLNPQDAQMINNFTEAIKLSQKYQDGCQIYKYLVQQEPESSNYYFNVGLCYRDMQKYDEAIHWLTQGLKVKGNQLALYYLSLIYENLQMHEEMFQCFEKAIRLNSTYSKVFQKIADYFSNNQQYLAQSLQFYQQQANHDQKNVQIYYDLGRQQYNKGQIYKSIQYYKKAVHIQPDKYYSYLLLASTNIQVKQFDHAINHLQIAISLQPNSQDAYNLLGNAYFGKGKLSIAIENYKKAIEINPKSQFPYFNLGLLYFNQFQYEQALKYFEQCIKANPLYSSAFYLISAIYMKQNEQKKAIKFLECVIQENPTNFESFIQLGSVYFQIWNYEQSLKYFKRAYQLNEKNPTSIYNVGITLTLLQRYQQGLSWIQKALQISSRDKYYLCGLGICYLKLEKYEECINISYKTINIHPDYYEPYFYLGKALKLSKKQFSQLQNYTDLVHTKQQKVQSIQCVALFNRGIGDLHEFFNNFNKILNILKDGLIDNEKKGKRNICKFMNDFASHIVCILRDYFQLDLAILLGIVYRDIGDVIRAKEYFERVINHGNNKQISSVKQKVISFYQNCLVRIKWLSFDYYTLLIEFMLHQILQENETQGFQCYSELIKIDEDLKEDENISNLIFIKRSQKLQQLRLIIQDDSLHSLTIQRQGKNYKKKQIEFHQISYQMVNTLNNLGQKQKDKQLKQIIRKLCLCSFDNLSNITAQVIKKELSIKQQITLGKIQQIAKEALLEDNKNRIALILQQYTKQKLKEQISLFILQELFQVFNLQPKVLTLFTSAVLSLSKKKLNTNQLFMEIDNIIENHSKIKLANNSDILYNKNNVIINLQSSILYEDYQFQKSNNLVKTTSSFAKSVESKLSADIIKPKQAVNKKSLALVSGIEPYSNQNIFQRKLLKGKSAKSSIYVGSTKISGFNSIHSSSKAFQSQILQDFDEEPF